MLLRVLLLIGESRGADTMPDGISAVIVLLFACFRSGASLPMEFGGKTARIESGLEGGQTRIVKTLWQLTTFNCYFSS